MTRRIFTTMKDDLEKEFKRLLISIMVGRSLWRRIVNVVVALCFIAVYAVIFYWIWWVK